MPRPYAYRALTRGLFGHYRNVDELVAALALHAASAVTDDERADLHDELTYAIAVYPARGADIAKILKNGGAR